MNMSPANKGHFEAEKEAIHLILTGIGDEIYSTVDACQTAQEMWEAIERLQQGEYLNIQDPDWSRFVTIFKQQYKLDEVSCHKLFDILKQYQKEVNELRTERLAKNANPLALVAIAQANQDPYYQTSKSQKSYAPSSKPSIPTRSHTTTRYKDKEIAKPITPPSENKNVDTTLRYKNDNQSRQFRNQRTMNVAGARENLEDTDEEIDEQELEAHYSYIAKIQENDQNDVESEDERVAVANLIVNLKLDTEFEKYEAFNDHTVDYDKLERKLNETLGQLAQKDIKIKEGLKTKAYEISVVKEKHDELIKQSLLTKSHYEGLVKKKTKVITDLKLKEEHDIDKMLSMEKQLKFLNGIVYKRSQLIQTIHLMAPKVSTYNGRPTFANPRYLKQAQSEIPYLYAFPYDQSTHANRLIPDREETLALEKESRSKSNKDLVRPYDYITLNSLYEIFKPPTQEIEIQLAHANEIRKKMWRKSFVKYKPNIFKNIGFLPVSKSISKSRQAYNVMKNNVNYFKEIVDTA
nr:hypothetical protein [Tanacetum cinerariifolium]